MKVLDCTVVQDAFDCAIERGYAYISTYTTQMLKDGSHYLYFITPYNYLLTIHAIRVNDPKVIATIYKRGNAEGGTRIVPINLNQADPIVHHSTLMTLETVPPLDLGEKILAVETAYERPLILAKGRIHCIKLTNTGVKTTTVTLEILHIEVPDLV